MILSDALEGALRAAENGDRWGAVGLLLEAWRSGRSAILGRLIVVAAPHLPIRQPPLQGKRAKDRHADWLGRAARHHPEDLPVLLPYLMEGNSRLALERLEALEGWPPDPRIADHLVAVLAEPPYQSSGSLKMWRRLVVVLVEHADVHLYGRLREMSESWKEKPPVEVRAFERIQGYVDKGLTQLQEKLGAVSSAPETAADPAVLETLETLLTPSAKALERVTEDAETAQGFLKEIAAAPDNDEIRLVFADWLLERNNPWGELIQLQFEATERPLKRAEKIRINKILREDREILLGPLAPLVLKKGLVLEKGFPVVCGLPQSPKAQVVDEALTDPRWATVRELVLSPYEFRQSRRILTQSPLISLASLRQVFPELACDLVASSKVLPVEVLELTPKAWYQHSLGDRLDSFVECQGMPRLRRLNVGEGELDEASLRKLLSGPLGRRLERLSGVGGHLYRLPELVRSLLAHPVPFRGSLSFSAGMFCLEMSCGKDGRWSGVRIDLNYEPMPASDMQSYQEGRLKELGRVIRELPPDFIHEIELVQPLEKSGLLMKAIARSQVPYRVIKSSV